MLGRLRAILSLRRWVPAALLAAGLGLAVAGAVLAATLGNRPTYYVAIGDSLSAGVQPDARGQNHPTGAGYADLVAARLREHNPHLRLVHFGGTGTTETLLRAPGDASDPATALERAERFLRAHRGHVALVTLNIGDNDVGGCISPGGVDGGCVKHQLAAVKRNLPVITRGLRAAAGSHTPLLGLADYDQFWAYWLGGTAGRRVARDSVGVIAELNATMLAAYARSGALWADAGPSFAVHDARPWVPLAGHGRVPRAVERTCALTWACSPAPVGFNDHANARGYRVIADVMWAALRRAHVVPAH